VVATNGVLKQLTLFRMRMGDRATIKRMEGKRAAWTPDLGRARPYRSPLLRHLHARHRAIRTGLPLADTGGYSAQVLVRRCGPARPEGSRDAA
jgi:hypothetical protein